MFQSKDGGQLPTASQLSQIEECITAPDPDVEGGGQQVGLGIQGIFLLFVNVIDIYKR
jgi:hypothetical protein